MNAVLGRLEARLHHARRQRIRAVAARAVLEALCVQLLLLPFFGLLSALHPYDPLGLQLALATWLVYLWPLLRLERARRGGQFGIQAIAADCDRLNPEAPDVFRTVLSRRSHSAETLTALDAFYAPWEARLRDVHTPVLTKGRGAWIAASVLFAVALPFVAANHGPLSQGGAGEIFLRMALPIRVWNAIPAPRLTPVDLPETVMRGDSVTVTVKTLHVSGARAVYVHVITAAGETRYVMDKEGESEGVKWGAAADGRLARYALGPADRDFTVRFSTAGFATRSYTIRVAEPPRLASLGVVVTPPAYTRLPAERVAEMPTLLSLLPGSVVTWTARVGESQPPLTRLSADYGSSPLKVTGSRENEGREFSFRHRVTRAGELRLRLADSRGGQATEGPFRVELKIDAPPEIVLLAPASDQDLGRTLKLPVLFRARDDYGISRVLLHYQVQNGGSENPAEPGRVDVTRWLSIREGMGGGVWDAGSLRLDAGDAVEMWLEAVDNDAMAGPKSSFSARVKLRLPSREEVRAAVEAGERDASVSLSSALEREKRLRREEQRPDKGASTENNPALTGPVPEWEVRRVLSEQPRQHLNELKRQIDSEIKVAEKQLQQNGQEAKSAGSKENAKVAQEKVKESERALKALQEVRKEVQAQEKRLPPAEIGRAPLEQQKKSLEALNADQKALEKKLQQTPAEKSAPESKPLAENRKQLEESLKRNLQEQKDMKAWLSEQDRKAATDQKRANQSQQNAAQMEQDMKRALEQIDKAMEKGLENGTLTPEVLEKMERIRELLEEVLDPGEKESLRQASQNDEVDAGDLQKAMRNLLDKKEGLRQSLENAIRMLEALRETRALRDAAAEVRELAEEQKEVASEIAKAEKAEKADKNDKGEKEHKATAAELAERQEDLNRQMDETLKGLESLGKNPGTKEAMKDLDKQKPRDARANMQKAAEKLKAPSPDKKAAKQSADLAAKQLKQVAAEMEKKVAKMDKAANAAEIRAMLEETLDFSGWLEAAIDPAGAEARRWGGEEAVRQGAVRIAKWLRARLEKLADADPFEGDVLRREAAALGFEADALAATGGSTRGGLNSLRMHALKAARELFKMLDKNQDPGGDEDGEGAGDSDNSGGEDGDSGEESLSGRMKGASGKQSAVNRATSELLRSFLEGRQGPSQGQPGGQGMGQGSGQGGRPMGSTGSPQAGGTNGQSGQAGSPQYGQGGAPGSEGNQSGDGDGRGENPGAKAGGLANAQQQIGESLEQMAESAGDAGGAARKLRQLAEEARELEEALRRRSLNPAEIQRRQERFQTRLLEAANALEERGNERERRAEAYKGGAQPLPEAVGASTDENRIRELKRRRDEARKLPLSPEQKRRVEWYFEQLLAP